MKPEKRFGKLWHILLAIIMMCAIISLSVVIILNFRPLYYLDMEILDISGQSGFSTEKIRENYDALIDYNSMFFTGELTFPSLPQSESGRVHFEEVKEIFVFFQKTAIATVLLSVIGIIVLRRERPKWYLRYAGILTIVLPVVIGGAMAVNWDRVFVLFHKLMFDNDYWLFDEATDPVILMLPDTFFLHCAVGIIGLVIVGAVVCLVVYRMGNRNR